MAEYQRGERRTIPQLVSTLSRQNQCDLNLLHPLQHPLEPTFNVPTCVAGWLAGRVPSLFPNFLFTSSFITGSSLPLHSMECVLSSPTMATSRYFSLFFFFFFFSCYTRTSSFGDFFCHFFFEEISSFSFKYFFRIIQEILCIISLPIISSQVIQENLIFLTRLKINRREFENKRAKS